MRAADLFTDDVKVQSIARELQVSEESVYQWRRAGRPRSRLYTTGVVGEVLQRIVLVAR
ncbi:hypothetical protein OG289_09285 [Streptomyces sp. NBC_01235]|nr:hypothetical protein OG289_09285 [Streptomyces sp. NBC_01235]